MGILLIYKIFIEYSFFLKKYLSDIFYSVIIYIWVG